MFALEMQDEDRLVIGLDIADVARLLERGFSEPVTLTDDTDGREMQISLSLQQQLLEEMGAPPEQIPEGINLANMRFDLRVVQEAHDTLARIFRVCPPLQIKLRVLLLASYIDGWNDCQRVVTILEDEVLDTMRVLGDDLPCGISSQSDHKAADGSIPHGWQHGDQLEDCGLCRSEIVTGLAGEGSA